MQQPSTLPIIVLPKQNDAFEIRDYPYLMRGKQYSNNFKPARKVKEEPDQKLYNTVQANIKLMTTDELNRVFNLINQMAQDRENHNKLNPSNYDAVCIEIARLKEKIKDDKRKQKAVEKERAKQELLENISKAKMHNLTPNVLKTDPLFPQERTAASWQF